MLDRVTGAGYVNFGSGHKLGERASHSGSKTPRYELPEQQFTGRIETAPPDRFSADARRQTGGEIIRAAGNSNPRLRVGGMNWPGTTLKVEDL